MKARELKAKAGRAGGKARWHKDGTAIAASRQRLDKREESRVEQSRGEESKEQLDLHGAANASPSDDVSRETPKRITWVTPFDLVWQKHYGASIIPAGSQQSGGAVTKVLKGVIDFIEQNGAGDRHEASMEAVARLDKFCAATEAKFVNIHQFARTHGTYASEPETSQRHPFSIEGGE